MLELNQMGLFARLAGLLGLPDALYACVYYTDEQRGMFQGVGDFGEKRIPFFYGGECPKRIMLSREREIVKILA